MEKKFWNSEKIVSFTAMLISICTLVVFVYQTNLIRKEQYLSVFPYLSIGHAGVNTDNYRYVLKNNGIGPALITDIKVKVGDSVFEEDLPTYLGRTRRDKDSINFFFANITPGRLVPEKEEIEMIAGYGDVGNSERLYQKVIQDSLVLIIEYESIYGEKWRIAGAATAPIKID